MKYFILFLSQYSILYIFVMSLKRRALLIGINYTDDEQHALHGCVQDVQNIHKLLLTKCNYSSSSIVMLTDVDEKGNKNDSTHLPTKKRIIQEFERLVTEINQQTCDEVWIHYSGHGYFQTDTSGDELDGNDEVIVPLDYNTSGFISDDFFYNEFLQKLTNPSIKIFSIFDCCHSGSQMDLPLKLTKECTLEPHSITTNDKLQGQIVCVSGCLDEQTSADTFNIYNSQTWSGVLTSTLLKILDNCNYSIRFSTLLTELHHMIKERKFDQIPQITTNFDITNYFFIQPQSLLQSQQEQTQEQRAFQQTQRKIKETQRNMNRQEQILTYLHASEQERQQKINELTTIIQEKKQEIFVIHNQIQDVNTNIDNHQETILKNKEEIESLQSTLTAQQAKKINNQPFLTYCRQLYNLFIRYRNWHNYQRYIRIYKILQNNTRFNQKIEQICQSLQSRITQTSKDNELLLAIIPPLTNKLSSLETTLQNLKQSIQTLETSIVTIQSTTIEPQELPPSVENESSDEEEESLIVEEPLCFFII